MKQQVKALLPAVDLLLLMLEHWLCLLATMVANLSSHKKGWDDRWHEFSEWAEKGQQYKDELLRLVDEDTKAFNLIMNAFSLPKSTEEEKIIANRSYTGSNKICDRSSL